MLNKLVRFTARTVRNTDIYLNGDDDKKAGKIEELKNEYKLTRQGYVPPNAKTKDEIDKATMDWAKHNGWDLPDSSS